MMRSKGFSSSFFKQLTFVTLIFMLVTSCNNRRSNNSADETTKKNDVVESSMVDSKATRPKSICIGLTVKDLSPIEESCDSFEFFGDYRGKSLMLITHDWISYISTGEIVVPDGQTWAYKDSYLNREREDSEFRWSTHPIIIHYIDGHFYGRKREYKLPRQGRDVVFYPGDVIAVLGAYDSYYIQTVSFCVNFHIDYLD